MIGKSPCVTVGMPVYNGEHYLRQSLDSLLSQTVDDFEIVISDNASTDRTKEICSEYAEQDQRIRYFRNSTNLGAARNYNRLIALAAGPYFRWAPADDVFAPTSLERCIEVLNAHPDVVLCYPKTILIDGDGNQLEPYEDKLDLRSQDPAVRYRQALQIGRANAIYGLMRTDVLRMIAPLGSYPGADVDLLIELCLYGRYFEISEPLYFRRMHAGAYSSLATLKDRQMFFDPTTCGKLHLSHWKRLCVRMAAVWRAPVGLGARLTISYKLVRGAVTSRKEFVNEVVQILRTKGPKRWLEDQSG